MKSPRQQRNAARRARHRAMWEAQAAQADADNRKAQVEASIKVQLQSQAQVGKVGGQTSPAPFGRASNILADILTLVDSRGAQKASLGGGL